MSDQDAKTFDLENRTFEFARSCRSFVKLLPRTVGNLEDARQLIRASGSIGANYIEANESLSKKDFVHRLKISRKEAKETRYWLRLIDPGQAQDTMTERDVLVQESTELLRILSAIIGKAEK
jgi:four helix bundle protein